MSATSIWVPVSSAIAALFGAGFGAMLQGRYGVSGWRRQIRLEAYTNFLNSVHDFDILLSEALESPKESNFDGKREKLHEALMALKRAGSLVTIAGPASADEAARSLGSDAFSIMFDVDHGLLPSIAHDRAEGKPYGKWRKLGSAAANFEETVRKVLKTQE